MPAPRTIAREPRADPAEEARARVFCRAAEGIWGKQWQTPASEALGISFRHIQRLEARQAPVQPGMLVDLSRLMLQHQSELDDIFEELKRWG